MVRISGCRARVVFVAVVVLAALAAGASRSQAAASCGIVAAAGHSWIVVANGVPCATAKSITRRFAAGSAALAHGRTLVVPSPLRGYHCLLANRTKAGGSCSTPGATRSVLWISAT